jgi:hypothetical protein
MRRSDLRDEWDDWEMAKKIVENKTNAQPQEWAIIHYVKEWMMVLMMTLVGGRG